MQMANMNAPCPEESGLFSKGRMKGIFSPIVAALGLIVIVFAANSAIHAEHGEKTALNMQAASEVSIKTENAVRIADKAVAKGLFKNLNGGGNFTPGQIPQDIQNEITSTFTEFNSISTPINCTFTINLIDGSGQNPRTINATITCTSPEIGGTTANETRTVKFNKEKVALGGGATGIKDSVSCCTEQPQTSASCPATCP